MGWVMGPSGPASVSQPSSMASFSSAVSTHVSWVVPGTLGQNHPARPLVRLTGSRPMSSTPYRLGDFAIFP